MKIKLNGKIESIPDNINIAKLLEKFNININSIVVEVNRDIIDKEKSEEVKLKDNDEVEFISFFGGG